jgi:hypothetical protein
MAKNEDIKVGYLVKHTLITIRSLGIVCEIKEQKILTSSVLWPAPQARVKWFVNPLNIFSEWVNLEYLEILSKNDE